ncbi:MAG: nitroreductase family protein [Myxococcota bacterium]|jgi:hypothetical protein|nr:hypothetical protein [Deltaproteobacteria bacterium]MDP7301181.1 nitroreductase family protein [Myxococcota bacterium]MDP7433838.1 nitroreductase family protein [Myxococcota bacterium]MDP7572101.1 nitroreductase family protein [Myxococcota bacterium]
MLGRVRSLLSRIPFLRSALDRLSLHKTALMDALHDLRRLYRYSLASRPEKADRQRLESLLVFYYHKVEKGLALPEVRPVFGLGYMDTLLDLLDDWQRSVGDRDAVAYQGACAALAAYWEHSRGALPDAAPELARRIEQFLTSREGPSIDPALGGTKTFEASELRESIAGIDFERLARARHSVRVFADRPVPEQAIQRAVRIAQRSPSVCNRQPWRVHVFTSPEDKAAVLRHQSGNAGFGHLADRILLITTDLRCFVSSGERNQPFVDGGLFAMSLVYGFLSQGIASCCLNLSISRRQELGLRRASRIPDSESPIMMLAIGYPPESVEVASSAREPLEAILSFDRLNGPEEPS